MEYLDRLIDEYTESKTVGTEEKRVIKPGFQKACRLESVRSDIRPRRKKKVEEKELELEEKLTIDAIRLRETLDPSRFYKKKSTENISKNFKIGTIIENPIEYYSGRATRREKKQTLVDELVADAEIKKRYRRIRATNAIKKREKALEDRRKTMQGRKKQKPAERKR